jgi:phenylacetate-CoA ligase
MYHERTSGTTGKPLETWRSLQMVRTLYAIVEARTRRWDHIPRGARFARLGGQLVVPPRQSRPPFWVWNAAMRQLYMSVYHLSPALIPYYLDALAEYRIEHIAGYTSSLHALAVEALRRGRRDLRMAAAFTNAEPLSPDQRQAIAAAFQCPVRDSYGMAEAVAMGSECPRGRLHLWPEVGLVEVHGPDGPAPPDTLGELVCTGLLNTDMPLIRYRVGDRGRLAHEDTGCPCGRALPQLAQVAGRMSDVIITREGRQVFWLNPVFYSLPVREAQIVQESLQRLRVLIAPAPQFTQQDARKIVERLVQRVGDMAVSLDYVDAVPRTSGGKVRAVVCALDAPTRAAALERASLSAV